MIRLLDRYVLSIFAPALGVFTAALMALSLAVDFASKLARFLDLRSVKFLPFVGWYYAIRLPMLVWFLLPMVVLVSTIFAAIKLARTNEILPVAVSGTSLRRMALPFVAAGALATGAMAALEEFVLARLGEEITRTEEILSSREIDWGVSGWDGRTRIAARSYNLLTRTLHHVQITRVDEKAAPVEVIAAQRCEWDAARGRWIAFEGTVERPAEIIEEPGKKPRPWKEAIPPGGHWVESEFHPKRLRKGGLTFAVALGAFQDLVEEARLNPHDPAARMKVHMRLTFPCTPLILVLLGLPWVVSAHSTSFIKGLTSSFLLGLGYYAIYFSGVYLGNSGALPAPVAAWAPTALFAGLGVAAFARMRT